MADDNMEVGPRISEPEPQAASSATKLNTLDAIESALEDALSGWRYLRQFHGELYGVGWERVEKQLIDAIAEIHMMGPA